MTDNVEKSAQILRTFLEQMLEPGVSLPNSPGVPLFSADDDDPDVIVRHLDGQIDRGRLVDGVFQTL